MTMRALGSSLGAWRQLERTEGVRVPHGLVFPLAVVAAIGAPHGLELVAEEHVPGGRAEGFDAVFVTVLDSSCMTQTAAYARAWGIPLRRRERGRGHPLVWAGGQGLHNPLPYAEVADLIVCGDAEDPLPELLRLWDVHGADREPFLAAAATVRGVYVPAHHRRGEHTIEQAVASDISITLREDIVVSLNGSRRVEIARGCQYKCTFCSLGWRTPVRENSAEQIIREIRRSPKQVHLQAGDAESHSGITEIRAALREHGGHDQGWTGRLDTLFENPDQTISDKKRYAFGVEGVSHRLRAAVGKGYLTDERLIRDTARFFESIEGENKGRAAWHVIAGLPGERVSEVRDLMRVIGGIREARAGKTARNLSVHWQPFQPLVGTPSQWCGAGEGARSMVSMLRAIERDPWVPVRQLNGRTDDMCHLTTILMRCDERGVDLLERMGEGRVSIREAEQISGTHAGPLDPDVPLPWDMIRAHYDTSVLRRAYDVMRSRLGVTDWREMVPA